MSQQKSGAATTHGEEFPESAIADYLKSHPDFFERHTADPARAQASASHRAAPPYRSSSAKCRCCASANAQLERQFKDLVAGREDERRARREDSPARSQAHASAGRDPRVSRASRRDLREDFGAERAVLVLFNDKAPAAAQREGFVRRLIRGRRRREAVRRVLARCEAALRPVARSAEDIFERDADSVSSAALVPLGADASLGFLIIGSGDPDHFHPGKRMDFLARLGELYPSRWSTSARRVFHRELADFLQRLKSERRLSPHTVTGLPARLERADRLLRAGAHRDLRRARFVPGAPLCGREPSARGLNARSIARRLSAVRTFLNFLVEIGALKSNAAVHVQAPKPSRRLPATLDTDQVASLLAIDGDMTSRYATARCSSSSIRRAARLAELVSLDRRRRSATAPCACSARDRRPDRAGRPARAHRRSPTGSRCARARAARRDWRSSSAAPASESVTAQSRRA